MSNFEYSLGLRQQFERFCATALSVALIGLLAYGSVAMLLAGLRI